MTMTRDKTGVFFLSVYQTDGTTPQDLTGAILYFHAAQAGQTFVIDKNSSGSGIVISSTAGGTDCAALTIDPADTTALPADGVAVIECELTMVLGSADYELASGLLRILPNVGTP